ncbi:MAG: chromate efflux transporter [Phycisphaerales bacterium]|nr:chromate efflux transporter [Phycisphaerales bacterium]
MPNPTADQASSAEHDARQIPFGEALRVWTYIGLNSFGGPAGQIAVMHRVLVEQRRWVSEARFLHALNYCMLLPGPEATQLATYIGWLMHRTPGGIAAGVLFVLPGFVTILLLSYVYAAWHDVPAVDATFGGLGAAVLAVVVEAVLRIGRRALANRWMVMIAILAFVAIHFLETPFPAIIAAAALVGFIGGRLAPSVFLPAGNGRRGTQVDEGTALDRHDSAHTRPSAARAMRTLAVCLTLWLGPQIALAALLGPDDLFVQVGLFFSKAAVVTFGGAYAVLPYVAQRAVETHGWLTATEMLRGLGLAETTPGPLIQVVQFVGFMAAFNHPGHLPPMLAATLAAVLTTWVTFVPCFLWIFLGAPYVEAARASRWLAAALAGVTAAVVGVVLNLAVWFALHTLFGQVQEFRGMGVRVLVPQWATVDPAALLTSGVAFAALFWWRLGMMRTLGLCAALALAHYSVFEA